MQVVSNRTQPAILIFLRNSRFQSDLVSRCVAHIVAQILVAQHNHFERHGLDGLYPRSPGTGGRSCRLMFFAPHCEPGAAINKYRIANVTKA